MLEPGPSAGLAGWLIGCHALALLLPWFARLPLLPSLLWSGLMLGLAAEALLALRQRRRYLPCVVALGADGTLRLRWGDQTAPTEHRITGGFRHPAVCLVRLQGFGCRHTLVLPRDCLDAQSHRRLRVYLTGLLQLRAAQSSRLLKGRGGSGASTVGSASGRESG